MKLVILIMTLFLAFDAVHTGDTYAIIGTGLGILLFTLMAMEINI
jgi:hypothetical protein